MTEVTHSLFRWFRSEPPPPQPATKAWSAYDWFYAVVWNPMGRVRVEADGLDKVNKLCIALLQGLSLYYKTALPRADTIQRSLKNINSFIGGTSFIGRLDDVFGVTERGQRRIKDKTSLKAASSSLLMIGKGAEAAKWLHDVSLLPVEWLKGLDASLGHIASRIGTLPLIQTLRFTELLGIKDTFVACSSVYGIMDNLITFVDTADRWTPTQVAKIWVSIVVDIGKIVLSLWFRFFTLTWTFVGIAIVTSTLGITKILLKSYTEGEPFKLPISSKV